MWVVSTLLNNFEKDVMKVAKPDFESELKSRVNQAEERERIGLLDEKFVYEKEVSKLEAVRRDDLSRRVQIVSFSNNYSFDIRSFGVGGDELHIEVKTTTRTPNNDDGFWLSEKERAQGEIDKQWVVYHVYNIDTSPSYKNLGNIVLHPLPDWRLSSSSWFVKHDSG